MSFTNDTTLDMMELNDEQLSNVTGTGGFGGFGACGCGGFFGGPFITTYTNYNADSVAYSATVNYAQSNVNQTSYATIWN